MNKENTNFRGPVVAIMGHVDHGKTTLLDQIRKTHVADREFGGITQHISSYMITYSGRPITFIDTPGHEAFFAMRERGAKITDILVLVVAADDGVMPQTKEVINTWKKTKTQLIVAINKIDMPGANIEKVKGQLANEGILVEGYGGDIPVVEISAKLGTNIEKLLELINLIAEMNELDKFKDIKNAQYTSKSIVLESTLDKHLGPVATVIVKAGSLNRGDFVVIDEQVSKIRTIINDQGKNIDTATESMPVKVVGINKVLDVGQNITGFSLESNAKKFASEFEKTSTDSVKANKPNLASLLFGNTEGEAEIKNLNLIIIADTKGSLEAIDHSLKKIEVPDTKLTIISARTGALTVSDIEDAKLKSAFVLTFNVKNDQKLLRQAEKDEVIVREYNIIYEMTEEIESALIGLVEPEFDEKIFGEADVWQVFELSNKKIVAGCRVSKDKILKGYQAYVLRKGVKVHEGKISSLKHLKEEVKEATMGTECGILLEPNYKVQTGDKIVCFKKVKAIF